MGADRRGHSGGQSRGVFKRRSRERSKQRAKERGRAGVSGVFGRVAKLTNGGGEQGGAHRAGWSRSRHGYVEGVLGGACRVMGLTKKKEVEIALWSLSSVSNSGYGRPLSQLHSCVLGGPQHLDAARASLGHQEEVGLLNRVSHCPASHSRHISSCPLPSAQLLAGLS